MRYALSFSGGKDSMLALDRAVRRDGREVVALFNIYEGVSERVRFHGVRASLIEAQAEALGIPLVQDHTRPDDYETVLAAGLAAAILVSRVASGEPQTGSDLTLNAIAAVILGGTSIYGGEGAVWRSLAGVFLLALIGNGFNLLSANPFYNYLVTGLIIVLAVALSASDRKRR